MPFITAPLWKILTGGAAVLAVVLAGLLFSSYLTNRDLSAQRTVLSQRINDPKTGYIAQLAQSRTNVEQLKASIAQQNIAYDKLSKDSADRLAATKLALAQAQRETAVMQRKLDGFLSTKPQGVTLEDRVRDIDHRALQEFIQ